MRVIHYLIGVWVCASVAAAHAQPVNPATIARIQALYDQPDPAHRAWLEQWLEHPSVADATFAESRAGHAPDRLAPAALAKAALQQLDIFQGLQQLQTGANVIPPASTASPVDVQAWLRWLQTSRTVPPQVLAAGPEHDWPEPLLRHLAMRLDKPAWRQAWLSRAQTATSLRQIQQQLPTFTHADLRSLSTNPALARYAWTAWAKRAADGDTTAQAVLTQAWQSRHNLPAIAAGLAAWPPALAQARRWQQSKTLGSAEQQLAALVLLHAQTPLGHH